MGIDPFVSGFYCEELPGGVSRCALFHAEVGRDAQDSGSIPVPKILFPDFQPHTRRRI